MLAAPGIEPVAVNQVAVGIEAAEERIGQCRLPHIVLHLHPVLNDLGALDLDPLVLCRLIDDTLLVGCTTPWRGNALAIDAFMHRDDVARLCDPGGGGNRLEWL